MRDHPDPAPGDAVAAPFQFCAVFDFEGEPGPQASARLRDAARGQCRQVEVSEDRMIVVSEVACRAEAWAWAEETRERLTEFGPVAVGLAWERRPRSRADLVNRADHAAWLARSRGGLCTWDMVAAERTAESLALRADLSPLERRWGLLRRRWSSLGAAQRLHLTDHCELVSEAAAGLGRAIGLHAAGVSALRIAGLMHDIGKVVIPDELLARPAGLTTRDRAILDRHAEEGARLASILGADTDVALGVRWHHARYDDPAWRDAAGATLLPLSARIMAVADALVTMTTDRPYREARTLDEALTELMRLRGTALDPDAVAAAFRLERARAAARAA